MSFFSELKRRKVFRVGAAYAVVAWLLIQIGDIIFPTFHAPDWVMQVFTILLVLGFPLAVVLAWAYDLTPEGIVLTGPADPSVETAHPDPWSDIKYAVIGLLTLALLYVIIDNYLLVDERPYDAAKPVLTTTAGEITETATAETSAAAAGPAANTIAVLPFSDLGPNSDNDWLGRGISEDILNLLAKIRELKVVARTSSFQDRLEQMDVRDIGSQLNVRYILEGSVRRSEDRIKIVAQLADTETGYHIWSQEYGNYNADVFDIQGEIAERVVKALRLALPVDFRIDPVQRPTDNIDAYDYYLQARSLLEQVTSMTSLQSAEQFFRRAIDLDAEFGLAHAGLCTALVRQIEKQRSLNVLHDAEASCNSAVKIEPESYLVHTALGELHKLKGENVDALREFNWVIQHKFDDLDTRLGIAKIHANEGNNDAAEHAFREALDISPAYSRAYEEYGKFLFDTGNTDNAIEIFTRLAELEPDSTTAYNGLGAAYLLSGNFEQSSNAFRKLVTIKPNQLAYTNIGTSYYYQGRFADAEIMHRQAIMLEPDDYSLWGNLGDTLSQLPDKREDTMEAYRQARKLTDQLLTINPNQGHVLAARAHYCARLNDLDCARTSVERALKLSAFDRDTRYFAAIVYLCLGQRDQAASHLEQAIELGFPMILANAEPLLSPLNGKGSLGAAGPERDINITIIK